MGKISLSILEAGFWGCILSPNSMTEDKRWLNKNSVSSRDIGHTHTLSPQMVFEQSWGWGVWPCFPCHVVRHGPLLWNGGQKGRGAPVGAKILGGNMRLWRKKRKTLEDWMENHFFFHMFSSCRPWLRLHWLVRKLAAWDVPRFQLAVVESF